MDGSPLILHLMVKHNWLIDGSNSTKPLKIVLSTAVIERRQHQLDRMADFLLLVTVSDLDL